jgi:uncharacterized protein (DUF362 family)
MNKVSIIKCETYDINRVRNSVRASIDHLGGIKAFVQPGEKVLLKVNLLMEKTPNEATTTHPSVVQALAELVLEAGGTPIICDNPGGHHFYDKNSLEDLYKTTGMEEVAQKTGACLNYDTNLVEISYPQGNILKNIKTIKPIIEADKIINVPKIKTHVMTIYTGAVKNLFGIIPGNYKAQYHLKFGDIRDFSNMLIDLFQFAKPVLTVMDAIIGMEGFGPSNGNPRQVGLVLASHNPFALDAVGAKIIGLRPSDVPTIKTSIKRGLFSGDLKDVEIAGEVLDKVRVEDYNIPTRRLAINTVNFLLPRSLVRWISSSTKSWPVFNHEDCRSCKICKENCPPKAIHMEKDYPIVDYDKCIGCFCCHELCAYKAVKIKRPLLVRILSK